MSTFKSAVNVDDEVMSETPTEEGGESPRTRSNVWKNFTIIGKDEEGYERATCNSCSHAYRIGRNPVSGQNYGTSHLTRHICKGGESTADNCQILQSRVNRFKSDKYQIETDKLRGYSCDVNFTDKELDIIEMAVYGDVIRPGNRCRCKTIDEVLGKYKSKDDADACKLP